ncbi:hypothetical protein DM02DRAFT_8294 [Periconia macrospinosa]|uniref:Uncharacterized protein n=1 Tax=Periconia macrospinosa TaxID=97972 RepID=A0A2V1EE28_9PLEO|nr:hypothetical protein DM02DRAFT_8294 [Periconia macrospinosa]
MHLSCYHAVEFVEDSQINLRVELLVNGQFKGDSIVGTDKFVRLFHEGRRHLQSLAPLPVPSNLINKIFTSTVLSNLEPTRVQSGIGTGAQKLVLVSVDAFGCHIEQWALLCAKYKFNLHILIKTKKPPRNLSLRQYHLCENTDCQSGLYDSVSLLLAIHRFTSGSIEAEGLADSEHHHQNLVQVLHEFRASNDHE